MFTKEANEVPTWANKAGHSTRNNTTRRKTHLSPPTASKAREPLHPNREDNATCGLQRKPKSRPPQAPKCRKRKKAALFFYKAFKGLRKAFVNYVSPAHEGTGYVGKELQKITIADTLHNDPGPWHEYGRLDSDTEDDGYNNSQPPKKTKRED
ncbi:hypothetical protein ANO14919_024870 [Xylariales sp. No.14919]|nr:hypothetical protein ANO14919_024870 [Xylariales sp. No.14919]